ncbi:MAG TPA: glycosyltransferase family 39 protein [Phycisphaerae bacterium]|nr:glycosyltransferase family 39 protein [Phycisphaerae bacterium]
MSFGIGVLVVAVIYAVGLTREIQRPWNGLHEWNGALYSLFARNFLRYPWEIHHGMPLIAVGEAVPAENERSIYPSHPAGLVWLVAASFRVLGESEWAARLVPIIASLGSVTLLMLLVRRRWGDDLALVCGLVYSIFPMTVYFGRMVNHEPVCTFFMLAAAWSWDHWTNPPRENFGRRWAIVVWIIAIIGGIWIDWAGALYGGLFAVYIAWQAIRRRRHAHGGSQRPYLPTTTAALCVGAVTIASAGMLFHIVCGGFDGRWDDLARVFASRASSAPDDWPDRAWTVTEGNFSLPGLFFGIAGLLFIVVELIASRTGGRPATALGGFGVLFATGVVWLALFWRQYQMHQYWAFYLGPFAALGCAVVIQRLTNSLGKVHRIAAGALRIVLLGVLVVFGIRGTQDYYNFRSRPSDDLAAWSEVRRMTSPDQRILVFPDPLHHEDWGGTRVRYINPPQFPYYADRPFDSEGNLDRVEARANSYPLYLVDMKGIGEGHVGLAALCERFPCDRRGNILRVDFIQTARPADGAPTSAK